MSAAAGLTIALLDLPIRFYSINILAIGFYTLILMSMVHKNLVDAYEIYTIGVPRAFRPRSLNIY